MTGTVEWFGVRDAFSRAAERADVVLRSGAVVEQWDRPSICAGMAVSALAGHLLGVVRTFERRRTTPAEPDAVADDPARGYHVVRLARSDDLAGPAFSAVRENAERMAQRGHTALVAGFSESVTRLRAQLASDTGERPIGLAEPSTATTLQQYTVTRIVELVVHSDDLAESVHQPIDPPDEQVAAIVIAFLVRAVQARLGDGELIRALAGRRLPDLLRAL